MKENIIRTWFWAGVLASVLIISGCCGDCASKYLGQFSLSQESRDCLNFALIDNRAFSSPGQPAFSFRYHAPLTNLEEFKDNCTTKSSCGNCCDTYEGEQTYIRFSSLDGTTVFDLNLKKDFLRHTPEEDPADIGEYISITMNNRLTGTLFLRTPEYSPRVTLNGVEYKNVFVVKNDQMLDPISRDPFMFYFNKDQGIVGYELANGEVWNLLP